MQDQYSLDAPVHHLIHRAGIEYPVYDIVMPSSSVFGRIILWCTNKDHLVMITCKDKIIVISPSEPLAFVMDYNTGRYNSAT
ncbi:MAG TPA: hypothetical protein VGN00_19880 [Puia sp.]